MSEILDRAWAKARQQIFAEAKKSVWSMGKTDEEVWAMVDNSLYETDKCMKCGKQVRAIFTTDIDYIHCMSCDFTMELSDWDRILSLAKSEREK